jgi:O-acetyl-ADP-ribose deacetylase (regulator of RNase III)
LPASHVIHTVGPIWQGGAAEEQQILENCYRSCLDVARAQAAMRSVVERESLLPVVTPSALIETFAL